MGDEEAGPGTAAGEGDFGKEGGRDMLPQEGDVRGWKGRG